MTQITKANTQMVVYTHPIKQTFENNIEMAVRSMRGEIVPERRQIKYAAKYFKNDFFETLIEVGDMITLVFGIYDFMNEARIEFIIDCIVEDFPDLYIEDVYVAFKKNLPKIQKYGELTIPNIMECLTMYRAQKNAITYLERDKSHKENKTDKQSFILPEHQVWAGYIKLLENIDAKKKTEAEELEQKKADLDKAVKQAKAYHETFKK